MQGKALAAADLPARAPRYIPLPLIMQLPLIDSNCSASVAAAQRAAVAAVARSNASQACETDGSNANGVDVQANLLAHEGAQDRAHAAHNACSAAAHELPAFGLPDDNDLPCGRARHAAPQRAAAQDEASIAVDVQDDAAGDLRSKQRMLLPSLQRSQLSGASLGRDCKSNSDPSSHGQRHRRHSSKAAMEANDSDAVASKRVGAGLEAAALRELTLAAELAACALQCLHKF